MKKYTIYHIPGVKVGCTGVCPVCDREMTKPNLSRHINTHKGN